jgi:hypothetical protein
MLDGRRVLIVEDEALVALELTEIVTGGGGRRLAVGEVEIEDRGVDRLEVDQRQGLAVGAGRRRPPPRA